MVLEVRMLRRFLLFGMVVFWLFASCLLEAAPRRSPIVQYLTSFDSEMLAADYFQQAHAALVYDPSKVIEENNGTVRYEYAHPSLWLRGLFTAFLAGAFLMLTSLGIFAAAFILAALHYFRSRSFWELLSCGYVFIGGFTLAYALLQFFSFQLDQLMQLTWVHFIISLISELFILAAALYLLGVFSERGRVAKVTELTDMFLGEYLALGLFGVFSAGILSSQKTSLLLAFARQSNLIELSGAGISLSVFTAIGVGIALFLYWTIASYFLKKNSESLLFTDLENVLAWFALYKGLVIIKPYIFFWHYNLLSAIVAYFAGVYFWMSVRMEVTYHYFDTYSKTAESGSFLHELAGFRFFNLRVFIKRIIAVVAFLSMMVFLGKTYLFYHRLTVRQVLMQAIKSL